MLFDCVAILSVVSFRSGCSTKIKKSEKEFEMCYFVIFFIHFHSSYFFCIIGHASCCLTQYTKICTKCMDSNRIVSVFGIRIRIRSVFQTLLQNNLHSMYLMFHWVLLLLLRFVNQERKMVATEWKGKKKKRKESKETKLCCQRYMSEQSLFFRAHEHDL